MITRLIIELEGQRRDDDPAPGTYRLTVEYDEGQPMISERLSWTQLLERLRAGAEPLRWHMRPLAERRT